MSVDAHIQQLNQKHQSLEDQLAGLRASPSANDVEFLELKRQKLRLKDEIARLNGN